MNAARSSRMIITAVSPRYRHSAASARMGTMNRNASLIMRGGGGFCGAGLSQGYSSAKPPEMEAGCQGLTGGLTDLLRANARAQRSFMPNPHEPGFISLRYL